jgi:hypothetical protein
MSEIYTLQTTLGPLSIQFTDAKHAYISTGLDNTVTVNRVQYLVRCHVYLWSDGVWHIGEEGKNEWEQRQSLYMTRVGWVNYKDTHPSRSAHNKAAQELRLAAHNFAVNNPAIIRDAQREHLREVAEKLEREYVEALNAADEIRKNRNLAQDAYDKFLVEVQ